MEPAALTYRDANANANDLTDFLDLLALAAGHPMFPELPPLVASAESAAILVCSTSGPARIPSPVAPVLSPGPRRLPAVRVERPDLGVHRHHLDGLLLELRTSHGPCTTS